jgi:hypothetical protein
MRKANKHYPAKMGVCMRVPISGSIDKFFRPNKCKMTGYLYRRDNIDWRYCPICGAEFLLKLVGFKDELIKYQNSLIDTKRYSVDNKTFQCPDCKKCFYSKEGIRYHISKRFAKNCIYEIYEIKIMLVAIIL